jgi:hypothetical protein
VHGRAPVALGASTFSIETLRLLIEMACECGFVRARLTACAVPGHRGPKLPEIVNDAGRGRVIVRPRVISPR